MLIRHYKKGLLEAGCDEAGRGCLAGPVFAAAVILPEGFTHSMLNDSKKLSPLWRSRLYDVICAEAVAWSVAFATPQEIDRMNILQASFLAMHRAIHSLTVKPGFLLIDGNRFNKYDDIPYVCIIKGDSKYMSIAAASVLAKVSRDRYMISEHDKYPDYRWDLNKGYPTPLHKKAISELGLSPEHRLTFRCNEQLRFKFQ
ncbi:MAG: ribonuclease HII [Bacteroidales bacterium]|nr:ribonuclease HII [Bacteroidales bacterium]